MCHTAAGALLGIPSEQVYRQCHDMLLASTPPHVHVPHPLSQQVPYFAMPCPPRQPGRTPLPLPSSFSVVISLHSLSLQAQLHQILHQALLYAVYPGPLGSASILLVPAAALGSAGSQPTGRVVF